LDMRHAGQPPIWDTGYLRKAHPKSPANLNET
jgi:hypothetical protein